MNRSFFNVFGIGEQQTQPQLINQMIKDQLVRKFNDAAFLMKNASSVIIVLGYGMAVAQAQHV